MLTLRMILITTIIFLSNFAHSQIVGRLKSFSCPSSDDSRICSGKCTPSEYEYEVRVDRSNRSIMIITYKEGKVAGIDEQQNCSIMNKDNWTCPVDPKLPAFNIIKSMMNGVYANDVYPNGLKSFHFCGKK